MASIEILENTLLKLLVRRGTNEDRKNITLDEGELGYASDTTRLFIGDGTTVGGNLIGNKFLGSNSVITLNTGEINDLAFDNDHNTLQRIKQNDGSSASDWETISNLVSSGDGTIQIDSTQRIIVGTLSAGNFSADSLGNSIELDTSNRIALSSSISIDEIKQRTIDATSYLTLPSKLKISSINYDFPSIAASTNNSFLVSNTNNELSWSLPPVITSTVPTTTANQIPAGTIVPFVTGADYIPYGWLKCDGSEVLGTDYPDLSGVISTRYGGTVSSFNLPDFTNGALYGTNVDDPFLSTKYSIASGHSTNTNELSAFGTTFIIKAFQDSVQAPTINFSTPLSATLNGVNITDTTTEFLSGTIEVGLSGFKEDNCIYKTVYLDEPVILADNISLDSGMTAWQTFDLSNIGPANIKAIFGVIRPGQMSSANGYEQIIYSTYDNTTAPEGSTKKFMLARHKGPNKRNDMHTAGFSARVDRANNNIYLARAGRNRDIYIEIHGYSV
jgi:microcystin-dependent protein